MMEEDLSDDCVDCGDISEGKADWLNEQAGDVIPEDPKQTTLSQREHLLSDKILNINKEVLQENIVWLPLILHCLRSLKNAVFGVPTGRGVFGHSGTCMVTALTTCTMRSPLSSCLW